MKKYWTLFLAFRKIQLMKMIEYRSDFWFWAVVSLMWTAFNFFFYGLLFSQGKGVPGWSYDQILLLLSFYTMMDAFTWSVFYPNMTEYTKDIFNGELSKYLVLPVNTEYLILTQRATYHNVPRFLVGLLILITTALRLNLSVGLWEILLIILLFAFGIILIYSCWFILATFAFHVERLANINEIMPQFRSVYQVPLKVFTGGTGVFFTFLLPIGLVTTLPSEVLLGRVNYNLVLYLILSSLVFATIAIKFFRVSIKKYSSVGG